jgi:hypothetical protein
VFSAGDVPVDVTVLPEELLRQAPLDRGGEKTDAPRVAGNA